MIFKVKATLKNPGEVIVLKDGESLAMDNGCGKIVFYCLDINDFFNKFPVEYFKKVKITFEEGSADLTQIK